MKIKHIITTLCLATSLGLGVGIGLKANKNVKQANATNVSTVYLMPNSNWSGNSAWFGLDVFTGSTHKWVKMSASSVSGVYQATIPEGSWTNIIFTRMNPASSGNEGEGWIGDSYAKWNQTGNLSIPTTGNNDCFVIPNDGWDSVGSWDVKYATGNSTSYLFDADDYFEMSGNTATISVWSTSGSRATDGYPGTSMTLDSELNGHKLYSFEYPTMFGLNKCIFNGGGDESHANMTKTNDLTLEAGKVYNLRVNSSYVKSGAWYTSTITTEATNFVYQKMHMTDYDPDGVKDTQTGDMSCKSYYSEAKTAYSSLTEGGLAAVKATYHESLERLSEWAKYNTDSFDPDTGFAARSPLSIVNNDNSAVVIVIISTISLLAVGGFFFIRKRKEER